jgi:hypothetical protein
MLDRMAGIDPDRSLAALTALGARCDCEILFDLAVEACGT